MRFDANTCEDGTVIMFGGPKPIPERLWFLALEVGIRTGEHTLTGHLYIELMRRSDAITERMN